MMSSSSRIHLLVFSFACLVSLTYARVARAPSGDDSQPRNRRQHSGSASDQYGRVCPFVVCPTIPDTCQLVEFFTMLSDYSSSRSQTATVRCTSCQYCLDVPEPIADSSNPRGRGRRNALHHVRHDCTTVTCPEVPSDCSDIRMTDVVFGNTKCKQCPACYDDTVFSRT